MVAEVFGGIGAFKAMFDLAKGLKEMDTANARNMAVIDLQERILTAQAVYAELTGRVRDLEEEVRRFETWETEKQRYELYEAMHGKFVYRLKEGVEPSEPPHKICAKCYQQGEKSILQADMIVERGSGMTNYLMCHTCGSKINMTYG